jgi:CheY-like chemotaxis protein
LNVLLVEDHEDSREMLAMALELAGHEVHTAADGRSAIARAQALVPDVVLLDLALPDLNGCDVLRELRAVPTLRHTQFVALTGWGRAEDRQRTKDAGFGWHLLKPISVEDLESVLSQAADARRVSCGR